MPESTSGNPGRSGVEAGWVMGLPDATTMKRGSGGRGGARTRNILLRIRGLRDAPCLGLKKHWRRGPVPNGYAKQRANDGRRHYPHSGGNPPRLHGIIIP